MNGFEFVEKRNDEETLLFKRCVRRLLDRTFILADKDERLYEFIAPESRQVDMNRYLSLMGYKVVVEDRMKLAMLSANDEAAETPGLRRITLYRFKTDEVPLLMVLWLLFLERMGYEEPVHVTIGDIVDKCRLYKIELKPSDFKNAYQVFKRFSLIDFANEANTEDAVVRLYPSLTFAFDIAQLKAVIAEYTDVTVDPVRKETEAATDEDDETDEE